MSGVVPIVFAVSLSEAVGQTIALQSVRHPKYFKWLFVLGWFAYLAVLFFLVKAYQHHGIGYVNAMWSGITSVLMLCIGHFLFKERLTSIQWFGIAVVILGVCIMNAG